MYFQIYIFNLQQFWDIYSDTYKQQPIRNVVIMF